MRCKVITGVTGDQALGRINLRKVRVGGVAVLIGAVQVKVDAAVIETFAAGGAIGLERNYEDMSAPGDATTGIQINMANAGDTVLVFYT